MENIMDIVFGIIMLAFDLFVMCFPLVILYAIYRVIKGLMTHNAKLKSQYGNKPPQDPENRWTSGQ